MMGYTSMSGQTRTIDGGHAGSAVDLHTGRISIREECQEAVSRYEQLGEMSYERDTPERVMRCVMAADHTLAPAQEESFSHGWT